MGSTMSLAGKLGHQGPGFSTELLTSMVLAMLELDDQ